MATLESFILPEYVHTTMTEKLMQNAQDYVTKTGGAIVPVTQFHTGHAIQDVFFKGFGEMGYRDPTTLNTGTFNALQAGEQVGAKIYWSKKIQYPLSMFKAYTTKMSPEQFSDVIATTLTNNLTVTMINKAMYALAGSLGGTAVDGSKASADLKALNMINRAFGDNAGRLINYCMHSVEAHNIIDANLNVDSLASGIAYEGTTGTLGRKVFATDSGAFDAGDTNGDGTGDPLAFIHALVSGGVVIQEAERTELVARVDDKSNNLTMNITMEGAFTLKILGYAWDESQGIITDDAVLGNSANWARGVDDLKAGAGVSGKVITI